MSIATDHHVQPQTLRNTHKPKTHEHHPKDILEIVDLDTFTPSTSNPINLAADDDVILLLSFTPKPTPSRRRSLPRAADNDVILSLNFTPETTPLRRRSFPRAAEDDVILLHSFTPKITPSRRRSFPRAAERGQSSSSAAAETFLCEICAEPTSQNESFPIKNCSHAYCAECVRRYVACKLQDNVTAIGCPDPVPGCAGELGPEHCRRILPAEVFDRWGSALCEAVIDAAQKVYCPFQDCSALLVEDGGEVVVESECPYCRRLFCAQCRVPWHCGVVCEEFQKLAVDERGREDIMVRTLAMEKNWVRCPSCGFYVEKVEGCTFVVCRCRVQFCYRCGSQTKNDHYCSKCKSS